MKKHLQLVSVFFLAFIVHTTTSAQCTYFNAVSDVTLNCTSFGPNKTGIAYNPTQNLYYSVIAGSTSYSIETFSSAGGNAISTAIQGANYRGYWWNATTSKPEGNIANSGGVYTGSLNASGYPTGVTALVGVGGQPTAQSAGALNLGNTAQILYYNSNALYRYNRLTGAFISSVTITGLPVGSNINLYHIIYTGIAGSEVGIYDYTNRRVLFIDYTTGVYTNYCQLPGSAPTPVQYNFAYANNRVFLYDQTNTCWIGYPITGASCPGETMQFNGGYVERAAFNLSSSWTAEAWIKPNNVSTINWNTVLGQDYWNAAQGFVIRIFSDSVGVESPIGNTYINAHIIANVWTHVAATYGNGVLTFYKDGVFIGARSMTYANASLPFHIGIRNSNNNSGLIDAYTGSIDEVRIWNTTRSLCDIQTYKDAEIATDATGLLANYHFNQGVASSNNTGITTLTDATSNANNGNLSAFTLTGTANNFIQPGAVTANNFNANPTPTGSISVTGNGNAIANNLAVTSTTNNTDFGSSITTRTFVITNSGPGSINIGKPYFTGTNPTDFIISTSPATVLASAASTTFVITYSPATPGVKSASVNINVNDCSKPVFKFLLSATSTTAEAFNFDGTNDAIAVPNVTLNNQSFTIEFWAKRNSSNPANCYAISQGSTGLSYNSLQIGFSNTNTLKFGFWNDDIDITNAACSDGQYHHWACVYKYGVTAGFNRFIYLDGQLIYASLTSNNYVGTGTFYIGRNIAAGGYFNGLLDEVRIWNTARNQCDIQSYKNCEIPTSATGLIANFHFNQGVASGANSTQTLVTDATGSGHTGTLTGAILTGTLGNWVTPGGVTSGSTTAAAPTSSVVITGNGNNIVNGSTSTSLANFTDFGSVFTRTFVINNTGGGTLNLDSTDITGTGAARFSIVSFPSRTITTGSTSVVISFTPNGATTSTANIAILTNDCNNPIFNFAVSGTGVTGAALAFAGSHTLTIPHSTAFNITTAISIEAWVNTTYAGESYIITKNDDSWYMAISGGGGATGKASFFLNGVAPGGWLTGTSVISDGNWHHVAGTYDGSMMRLYVDGKLEAQTAETGAITTGTNTVRIGSRTNATPLNFTGMIDELRIWNTTRSQCEVQRYMNCEIPTTFTGLVANYHFNQGTAGGNNAGINTLTSSAGGNTGNLLNFALTGTAANWVAPGGVVSSFTTVSTNTPTITVRGNGNIITDGSTSASATNFTDFGSLTIRTFVISNAAGSTLTIGTPYITGANASEYTVSTAPASTLGSSGTSSFVVTFNAAAAGTRTATINFVTNDCATPIFNFVVSATAAAGAALNFDGSNDYIKRTETNFSTGNFCIELWVRPTSFTAPNGDNYLITNRSNDFSGTGNWYVLGLQPSGQVEFNLGTANLAAGFGLLSPASLTLNTWQHVAVSRTGTFIGLYINGLLVASGVDSGLRDLNSGYNIVTFGAWGAPLGQRYFAGDMDEVRLWSTNRTQCQIQSYMSCEIPTTATSLIGNYHFNQGIAGGNNTGQANLTDVSASATNGVFNGFSLSGTGGNFITTGGVVSGFTTTAAPTSSISVLGNGIALANNASTTTPANGTNFSGTTSTFVIDNTNTGTLTLGQQPYISGANALQFSITVLPANSITTGTTSFVVNYTGTTAAQPATVNVPSNDCSKPVFSFAILGNIPAAALSFSGATNFAARPVFNTSVNNITMQAKVFLTAASSTNQVLTYNGNTSTSGYGIILTPTTNEVKILYGGNSLLSTGYFVPLSQWTALSLVIDNTYARVYANGQQVYVTTGIPSAAPTASYLVGGNQTGGENLKGVLDEVLFWSRPLTQCEILTNLNNEIATSATSLVANYHFNQGSAAGINTLVTTVADASGNGFNLTLNNFTLSGSSSNWVTPGGVVSGFTTGTVPTSTLIIRGNAVNITNGAVITNTANFTDFASASSRSFAVVATGTGTLYLSNLVTLSGGDASSFSIIAQPATSVATGSTSSFNISFIPVSAGTKTAIVTVNSSDCSSPNYSFVITASVAPGAALNFDGVNDFISVTNTALLSNFGIAPFTMEAWVYPTNVSSAKSIIRKDGDYNLLLNTGGVLQAESFPGGSGGGTFKYAVTTQSVTLNQWSHVAAVWNGTVFTMYINGLAVPSTTGANSAAPTSILFLGYSNNYGQGFTGSIDEVRLWKIARTQCDIQSYMNCEISVPSTSLVANYHFNQGIASGSNSTYTVLPDFSGNNHTGALGGPFTYTGSTSNWITPGGVVNGFTTSAVNISTMTVSGNGNAIPNGNTATSTLDLTDFNSASTRTFVIANQGGTLNVNSITFSGANASSFSVTSIQSFSLGSSNASFLTVAFVPAAAGTSTATVNIASSNCTSPNYSFVITASVAPASALDFDGVNDYVEAPHNAALSLLNALSVEAWVKPADNAGIYYVVTKGTDDGGTGQYGLVVINGFPQFHIRSTSTASTSVAAGSSQTITPGVWTHLAGTWDGSAIRLYVNGILQATANASVTMVPNSTPFRIGRLGVVDYYFKGSIDEVRVWNTSRSQCNILKYMNAEATSTLSGLVANYHLNQGVAGSNNIAVTTATDASSTGNTGTLSGPFALTGTTSNWVSPGGVTSGSTTPASQLASITLTANNNAILSATAPSTLNFTDFNGAATRTFVIINSGTDVLYVGTPYITGVGNSEFSLTTAPATSLIAGASTSLVIAFTPTASGVRTASVNISSNDCGKPVFVIAIQGTAPLASALNFDGTNDIITVPYNASLSLNSGSFTVEFWAKPTVVDNNFRWVISKDNGNSNLDYQVGITSVNVWRFCARNLSVDLYGTTVATPGTLYHIAAVFDGTTAKLYVNGILEASTNNVGTTVVNTSNVLIGARTASSPIQNFYGFIDDLRLWNVARTQCDINAYKNCEIATTASGLLANYHFNQGAAGLANPTVTVLADAAGTFTGTLSNFALTGATSNWVAPGGVITGSFTPAVVASPTLVISGNGNTVTNGSVLTSTTNLTDFASASTRTFVIQNTSTVTANIFSGQFTGANAASFSLTTLPSTVITAGGSSSFVVSFIPAAVGSNSATLILNSSDCTTPNYSFVITASASPASALNFDGVNDYVEAPNTTSLMLSSSLSLEAWVKLTTVSGTQYLVSKGTSDLTNGQYGIVIIGGVPQFHMYNSGHQGVLSNYTLTAGVWTHLAATWDGATMRTYANGILNGSASYSTPLAGNTGSLEIGRLSPSGYWLNGNIDELRIWNTSRSQCEIQTYMNAEIPTTATGLVANYHFNQGVPSGINTTVTTLTDAASGNTGTLGGPFALSGNTSNWVSPGGVVNGFTTTSVNASTMTVSGNGNAIPNGSTGTSTLNSTDFNGASTNSFVIANQGGTLNVNSITLSGANPGSFSITSASTFSLGSSNSSFLVIAFTPTATGTSSAIVNIVSSDCASPNYSFVITASATTASALNFDGNDDHVILGNVISSVIDPLNTITVEAWVYPTAAVANGPIVGNYSTPATAQLQFLLRQEVNAFSFYVNDGGGFKSVYTPSIAVLNTWQHVVGQWDGSKLMIYVNGVLQGVTTGVTGSSFASTSNSVIIGYDSYFTPEKFLGSLDEIRIWTSVRTQCEIQSYMNCEIPTTVPGLLANYHFNQGLPSGVNTAVNTLTSSTGSYNGILANFNLNGATSNWVSPGGVVSGYSTASTPSAEINIVGNNVTINNNDLTPSITDNTDMAGICLNAGSTKTFTIQNLGTTVLTVSSLSVVGTDASLFTMAAIPGTIAAGSSNTFAITFSPTTAGIKNATVNIVSSDCDEALYAFAITGSVIPTPTITVAGGSVCSGSSFTLTPSGASTYTYSGGSAVVSPTTTTSYSVTGTSAAGCISASSATATVVVNSLPAITIAGSNTFCAFGNANFIASGALSYTWNTGATTSLVTLSPTITTTYSVTGADANGCLNSASKTLSVIANPTVTVNSGSICAGQSFTFNASGASTYTYANSGPVVSPTITTSYSVTGTATTGCSNFPTTTMTVTVVPLPTVTISNYTICSGNTVTLSPSGAVSYTYSGGSAVVSPTTTTSYSVTGTSAAGCINASSATATVVVNSLPAITIAGSNTFCAFGNANFIASGALSYTWNTGATTSLVTLSPTITTTYSVTGADANGCLNSASKTLSVIANPTVTVNSGSICAGQSFTFNASGASTYTYANSGPVVSPTITTSYSVTGTATTGCSNFPTTTMTVTVVPLPTVAISNYTICSGNTVTLSPSGAVSYTFQGGSATVNPGTTTSYSVAGSNASGCISTATSVITVNSSPTLAVSASSSGICNGSAATLTVSGASTYTWSNALNTTTISVTPTVNTTYSVAALSSASCPATASIAITVNALPTITIPSGAICPGNSYTLNPSGAVTYSYSSGSNVVSPSSTTSYSITGASAAGCVASTSAVATVSVVNTVTVTITGNTLICNGQAATLTAGGASTYSWSNGINTASVALSPSVNTTYTVYGVSGTCSNTAVVSVSVNASPTITVNNGTICTGNSFTLVPSGASTYTYSGGSAVVSPVSTTTYSVIGTNTNNCVSITPGISTVSVNALPVLSVAASSPSVCNGSALTLTASGAVTYSWTNSLNSTTLTTTSISASPSVNVTYSLSGTDANSCIGYTTQAITVNALPTITIPSGAICPGNSYTLNPSGAVTYSYSSGSNVVSPSSTTSYSVTGTSAAGCVASSSAVATVSVVNTLTVSVTGNTTICNGQTATLTGNGATTYSWSNGTVAASVALSPSVNTTYTVYGVSGTCSNTAVVSVSVNASPTITVNSGTICYGGTFTMNPSGAVSYSYSSGSANVSPTITSSYSVTGSNAIGCVNINNAVSTVSVNSLPVLNIAASSPSVCNGSALTLTASGAFTYSWTSSLNTTTLNTTSVSVSPTANATYSLSGTDANSCVGYTTQVITVNALPTITIPNGAICPGNSYTLNPSGAVTYSYSSGSNVVTPSSTTSYSVTGASAAGCVASTSAVATVSVVNTLTVSVTGNTTICNGQTATLTGNGATTYSWSNGISTTSVALTPSVNTNYTVYGVSGTCSNTAVVSVSVNASPTITVNNGTICTGSSFTLVPSGASTYTYSSGSAIVSPVSTTSYSVIGTNTNNCVSLTSAISTVSVNALPVLSVAASSPSVCNGSALTLTASGAVTYSWTNSLNSTTLTTTSISESPTANVTYSLSGTDANSCIGYATQAITVNALPTITIPSGAICPGNSYTLNPSGASTYSYSSGSNVVTPSSTTSYSVTGASAAGCIASTSAVATVSVVNTVTISVTGNTVICNNQTTTLTAGGASTYSWSNGITTASVALSPSVNTTYTIYGASGSCSNTAVVSVSVNANPTITVNSGTICSGTMFVIVPSGASTYSYSGGSASVSPVSTTTYAVIGTNAANCVSTTSVISTVSVNASPTLAIASPTSVCNGSALTLTVSGASTYTWNNSLTTTTISVVPAGPTTYTVNGTDLNNCTGSVTRLISIDPLPTITVNGGAVCPGGSFTLTPSGAATYTYSSGSNVITPVATDSYSITGTSAAGCVASTSAVATVSVVSTLTVSVTGNTNICNGQTATLTAGGASSYSWSTNVTTSTITLSPTSTTQYTVYGISGSCFDKAMVTVSVNALPTVSVNSGTACAGSNFTLIPSGAATYSYSGGSSVINTTVNTSYSVTGTDANGCVSSNTAIASITVAASPTLVASVTGSVVCAGASTSLNVSGADTYTWSNGATNSNIAITPTVSSVYSVSGTATNGCQNTTTLSVPVSPGPSLTILSSIPSASTTSVACAGNTVNLSVSGASTYTWSSGVNSASISVTPIITTSYSVSATSASGCLSSAITTVTVNALPSLTLTASDTLLCSGSSVSLDVKGAATYSWSTGEITSLIVASPAVNTTYSITGTSAAGCVENKVITITVKTCEDTVKLPLKIVSGITPNNDGINDTWVIANIEDYNATSHVSIFNRWGNEVASIKGYDNVDKVWPAKGDESKLTPGTYFYIIQLDKHSKPIKGWVEVVK